MNRTTQFRKPSPFDVLTRQHRTLVLLTDRATIWWAPEAAWLLRMIARRAVAHATVAVLAHEWPSPATTVAGRLWKVGLPSVKAMLAEARLALYVGLAREGLTVNAAAALLNVDSQSLARTVRHQTGFTPTDFATKWDSLEARWTWALAGRLQAERPEWETFSPFPGVTITHQLAA
jgi:hypothetical protein